MSQFFDVGVLEELVDQSALPPLGVKPDYVPAGLVAHNGSLEMKSHLINTGMGNLRRAATLLLRAGIPEAEAEALFREELEVRREGA